MTPEVSARALSARGRHREAFLRYAEATARSPGDAELACEFARCAWRLGLADEGERALRRALALRFDAPAALVLARRLASTRRTAEARMLVDAALRGGGDRVEALATLARCHRAEGDGSATEHALREALALAPDDARLWRDLALLYALGGRDADAETAWMRGAGADADGAIAYALAERRRQRGDYAGETGLLVDELRRRPNPAGHFMLAEALLAQGRYRSGWRQFEFRRFERAMLEAPVVAGVPFWRGEPLDGRTILVVAEQGIGDVAWFARYLPMLGRRGARVVLLPRADMQCLSRGFAGVDQVLGEGERLPALDFQVPMMSLAHRFATTLDTIPGGVPYLRPDTDVAERWRRELPGDGMPCVGLVWAGKPAQARDAQRSMNLATLLPVLRVRGWRFYSLQKGPAEAQLADLPPDVALEPLGEKFAGLDDLAGAIVRMDLILSVCTGPAHLAGAMGKPVWTMISHPPDLRWMQSRSDSPWYPTMRLFRQSTAGRWDDVVAAVSAALSGGREAIAAPRAAPGIVVETDDGREDHGLARVVDTRVGLLMADSDEKIPHPIGRVDALARRADVVLILGAGVGVDAIAIASTVGAEGLVLAQESDARRRALLGRNVAVHAATNVSVLEPGGDESVDALALERLDGIVVTDRREAEACLAGAVDTLWRARPWLLLHSSSATWRDLISRIQVFGYATFRMPSKSDDDLVVVAMPEERADGILPLGCVKWP